MLILYIHYLEERSLYFLHIFKIVFFLQKLLIFTIKDKASNNLEIILLIVSNVLVSRLIKSLYFELKIINPLSCWDFVWEDIFLFLFEFGDLQ